MCLCLAACGGGSSGTTDAGPTADADPNAPDADPGAPDAGPNDCTGDEATCIDAVTRRYCNGGQWQEESCGNSAGCVLGACTANACSDECNFGDENGGSTCELFDMGSNSWVSLQDRSSMHDRARAYQQWLRRDGMQFGGVGNAIYSDPPTYSNVISLGGLGDSAIWTGTYLAAEALRLKATGAADARANVIRLVNTLHLWFNVSGHPGNLARFAVPTAAPRPVTLGDLDCDSERGHCGVDHQGTQYDYIGHISRDQYQGVMLGYALAYEALGSEDEATRALIRDDVVELVEELMKERTVSTKLTWNGTALGPFDVTMRFAVLNPDEMDSGAVHIIVDSNNTENSEMYGFQEFMPNLAHLVRQFPGLGFVPDIPRAGSGVMLSSFFRVALLVTDGIPAFASRRAAIETYYTSASGEGGNVNDWLNIAKGWTYNGECGGSYYATNIVMEPMHNLARLETDATRLVTIRNDILHSQMWSEFDTTKNSWFSFIYAANYPSAPGSVATDAASQLSGFPPPPRVKVSVNLTAESKYMPHEGGCANQTSHSGAVDVADRVPSDFIWQRHPWGLLEAGNPAVTYPGVDYLAAYWLGRSEGFISDDKPSSCLRWRN